VIQVKFWQTFIKQPKQTSNQTATQQQLNSYATQQCNSNTTAMQQQCNSNATAMQQQCNSDATVHL
jgi:hypothetical protein